MTQIRHRGLGVTADVPASTVRVWLKHGWKVVKPLRNIAGPKPDEETVPVGDADPTPSEED